MVTYLNLEEYKQKHQLENDQEKRKKVKLFLKGLKRLHSNSVLHGDIRPQNIWIGKRGHLGNALDYDP